MSPFYRSVLSLIVAAGLGNIGLAGGPPHRVPIELNDSQAATIHRTRIVRLTPGSNLPPVANPDTFWLEGLKPYNFTTATWSSYQLRLLDNDTDPENDGIGIQGLGTPTFGTVTKANINTVRFAPPVNYTGPSAFTYTLEDTASNLVNGQVSLNIVPSQDSPEQVQRFFWGRALDKSNFLNDAKLDDAGNMYVTGTSGQRPDLGSTVGVAIKILPDGTTGWAYVVYADAATKAPIQFIRVLTSRDRIYFVGRVYNAATGWDIWVSAFPPTASEYYETSVPLPTDDYDNDAKVDRDGNLVVAGYIGNEGATVLKFDSNANLLWRRGIAGTSGQKGAFNRIAVANDNTSYAAGFASNASNDILATCLEPDGTVRWSKTTAEVGSEYLNDVAVDNDGNPVFVGTKIAIEPIVFKLDATNSSLVRNFNVSLSGYASGDARYAATGPDGVVVCGHRTRLSDNFVQPFVLQLASDLSQSWLTDFVPPYSTQITKPLGSNYPSSLTLDGSGAPYITTYAYLNDYSSIAAYVASFDLGGSLRWSRFRQGPTRNYAYWNTVAVNEFGNVVTAGNYSWPLTGDPNGLQGMLALYQQTPVGKPDAYEFPVGGSLTVPANGVLANDRFLADGTAVLTKRPLEGRVSLSDDGSFTYTPRRTTTTPQSFEYAVQRPNLPISAPTTVTLSFVAKPTAVRDYATATPGIATPIDVLQNDSDPASRPLFIESVTAPTSGVATISGGSVIYTPTSSATGADSFSYTVSNGVATATAIVSVKLVPDPVIGLLRPVQINVGQKDVRVRVLGRNFGASAGAVVLWKGIEQSTTFVNSGELNFTAPNEDLSEPGTATIVVRMPLGRVSGEARLPIVGTPKFTATAGRRKADNSVVITITNIGTAAAQNLAVQTATVNGVSSTTNPAITPSLAVGGTANVTLVFPASAFSTPRNATCVLTLSFVGGTMRQSVLIRY